MKNLVGPVLLSIVVHALLILLLAGGFHFFWNQGSRPLAGSGGNGSVMVEIVGDGGMLTTPGAPTQKQSSLKRPSPNEVLAPKKPSGSPTLTLSGQGTGHGDFGVGSGPSGGNDLILAMIRARIEQAKRYPTLLRQSGVQGVAQVNFHIDADGHPEDLSIKTSSGSPALDEEALATIRRAAPYPAYESPLTIAIRFELKDE